MFFIPQKYKQEKNMLQKSRWALRQEK